MSLQSSADGGKDTEEKKRHSEEKQRHQGAEVSQTLNCLVIKFIKTLIHTGVHVVVFIFLLFQPLVHSWVKLVHTVKH